MDADTIKDWNPGGNALTIPTPIFRGDPLDNDVAGHDWGKDACTECWLGKRMVESPDLQESVLLSQKAIGTIRSFPNPIHRGQELIISHTAHTGESISVSVTNSLGKQVLLLQESDHSNQSIPIPTTDLPAGVYTIIMSNNNSTQHLRFIVVE